MMTVGEYLNSVAQMHGLTFRAMARALKVHPSALRRWRRDLATPSWRRIQSMTAMWGGNAHVIFLGSLIEAFRRETGLTAKEARRLWTGRAMGKRPKRSRIRSLDRAQLRLPMSDPRELRS